MGRVSAAESELLPGVHGGGLQRTAKHEGRRAIRLAGLNPPRERLAPLVVAFVAARAGDAAREPELLVCIIIQHLPGREGPKALGFFPFDILPHVYAGHRGRPLP
jgi:hypothetical protein